MPSVRCDARVFPTVFPQDRRAAHLPEAFVNALTNAGWMAALIPQSNGGSGLGLTEASGHHGGDQPLRCGNSGACHGQM